MSVYPDLVLHKQLIAKYFIPNMGDYSEVGSELSLILLNLDVHRKLSIADKQWIRDKGMFGLCDFVEKLEETGESDFSILKNHLAKVEKRPNPYRRRNAFYGKRSVRPALWDKYSIDNVKRDHSSRMNKILKELDQGKKLLRDDKLWLSVHDYFYRFQKVRQRFHMNEAISYHESFDKEKDPWQAINASSHYRKAKKSQKALDLLSKIDISRHRHKRLKSAFNTTKGGCMRDLEQFAEAIKLAEEAHSFDPNSFHPCTLLGALNYDVGNYILGDKWFKEAVVRGAKVDEVDQEIRSIFIRSNKVEQEKLKQHLLNIDPDRYSWVQDFKLRKKKQ